MNVTDVRSMRLTGPRPHSLGGQEGIQTKLLVRVDTDAGLYGLGEVDDFMGVREALQYIKSRLVGRNPFDVKPFLSEMLYGTLPPHPAYCRIDKRLPVSAPRPILNSSPTATPTGPIVWGISGVEMAMCDLMGKALKTPVYNLLGGKYRNNIRVYLDRSSPQNVSDLDAWRKLATEALEEGFTQLKLDVDYTASDCAEDFWNRSISSRQMRKIVERVSAVRETVGWDAELCVDCHMQYNAVDAIRLAHELSQLKLRWLEDPTPISNPDACAQVRQKSPIPICVGEMFIAEQFRLFIDRQACDIIHPDVLFSGGLHETVKISDYAELHYIPMAMHGNGGSLATIAAAHVAAATRNFWGLEYHFSEAKWIGEFVQREGVSLFNDGCVDLTDAPGLGVEINEEVCKRHLAPGESLF